MRMPRALAFLAGLLIAFADGVPTRAAEIDLALVLAIDASSSVDEERYDLQIRGYAEAFRNPAIVDAIKQLPAGTITVTVAQWAGYGDYRQVVGWTDIHDVGTASRFAGAIADSRRVLNGSTSLSGAIDFSARLLRINGHSAGRRVIDISGDGVNNDGRPAASARDDAVATGITINGLPILTREPALDAYYRKHVIGGPGGFLIAVEDLETFSEAILRKLMTEIAGTEAPVERLAMPWLHDAPSIGPHCWAVARADLSAPSGTVVASRITSGSMVWRLSTFLLPTVTVAWRAKRTVSIESMSMTSSGSNSW